MNRIAITNLLHSPIKSLITLLALSVQTAAVMAVAGIAARMPIEAQKRETIVMVFSVICFSTIFLTTYSAVSSRGRQIAVMRGLGGFRLVIARAILWEFAFLTVAGVGIGLGSIMTVLYILRRVDANIRIGNAIIFALPMIATICGMFGALCRTLQVIRKYAPYLKNDLR